MQVIRNVMVDPYLVPGGGAFEMALARMITEKANSVAGVQTNTPSLLLHNALYQSLSFLFLFFSDSLHSNYCHAASLS